MKFLFGKDFSKDMQSFMNKPNLVQRIWVVVDDFQQHLFVSKYYRKKLKGYENIHELAVGGDVRIIIEVIIQDDVCYFLHVGTHSGLGL